MKETSKYSNQFLKSIPDDDDYDDNDPDSGEELVKYDALLREAGYEGIVRLMDWEWEKSLALEVVVEKGQSLSSNEVVISAFWKLTGEGANSDECKKSMEGTFK